MMYNMMYHFNNATSSVQSVATAPDLHRSIYIILFLCDDLASSYRTDNWSFSTGVTSINLDDGASIAEYLYH